MNKCRTPICLFTLTLPPRGEGKKPVPIQAKVGPGIAAHGGMRQIATKHEQEQDQEEEQGYGAGLIDTRYCAMILSA